AGDRLDILDHLLDRTENRTMQHPAPEQREDDQVSGEEDDNEEERMPRRLKARQQKDQTYQCHPQRTRKHERKRTDQLSSERRDVLHGLLFLENYGWCGGSS